MAESQVARVLLRIRTRSSDMLDLNSRITNHFEASFKETIMFNKNHFLASLVLAIFLALGGNSAVYADGPALDPNEPNDTCSTATCIDTGYVVSPGVS